MMRYRNDENTVNAEHGMNMLLVRSHQVSTHLGWIDPGLGFANHVLKN